MLITLITLGVGHIRTENRRVWIGCLINSLDVSNVFVYTRDRVLSGMLSCSFHAGLPLAKLQTQNQMSHKIIGQARGCPDNKMFVK